MSTDFEKLTRLRAMRLWLDEWIAERTGVAATPAHIKWGRYEHRDARDAA